MRTFTSSTHGNINFDVCTDKKRLCGVDFALVDFSLFLRNCAEDLRNQTCKVDNVAKNNTSNGFVQLRDGAEKD